MTTGITTLVTKLLDQPRNNPLRLGNTRLCDHNKSGHQDTGQALYKLPQPRPTLPWHHALTHFMRHLDNGTLVRAETKQHTLSRMGKWGISVLHNILTLEQIKLWIFIWPRTFFSCRYVNFLFQNGDNYPDTKIIRTLCKGKMENISLKEYFLFSYYW